MCFTTPGQLCGVDDIAKVALFRELQELLGFLPEVLDFIKGIVPVCFFLLVAWCGFVVFLFPFSLPVAFDGALLFFGEGFLLAALCR